MYLYSESKAGEVIIICKNFGKIFRYAFRRTYFFGKILRKKGVHIMYTYIEGRVVRGKKRGSKSKGVQV